LSIFMQSAKTNQTSEEIIDATYLAQTEMEKIYEISLGSAPTLTSIDYEVELDSNIYVKEKDGFFIEVELINFEDDLKRILIKVYDLSESTKPKAQMENLLKWGSSDEE